MGSLPENAKQIKIPADSAISRPEDRAANSSCELSSECSTLGDGRERASQAILGFRHAESTHICGRETTLATRTTAAISF